MKKQKLYFETISNEYFMPNTQQQGWGQITGQKTVLTQTEVDGVRTRIRTDA